MVDKNPLSIIIILSVVIVVLALIILGFVGYYMIPGINHNPSGTNNSGTGQASNQLVASNFNGTITSAEFQTFPAGTQFAHGMNGVNGTVTNVFNKNDTVELVGQTNVNIAVVLTIKVFDANGNDMGISLRGGEFKIQSGGFGTTIDIPQTSGNYTLKLYLNNNEVKSMPFQIL